jgi:phosphatidylserine/phosphatidylglycerophosphate/cardiolipin synthase-like enzyme
MPFKNVRLFANCDMTLIAWQTEAFIPGCRGFAIMRETPGASGAATDDFVNAYVGFVGGTHTPGESQPSTVWPVQRFFWNDYAVTQGQQVRYRVIPMMGTAAALIKPAESEWSGWTDWLIVGTGQTPGFEAYFNRGIVGAQFMARQADTSKQFTTMLKSDISKPGSKNREFLSGPLRIALLALLAQAQRDGVKIYTALYELNDPEIIAAFTALGKNCNLLLGSGAFHGASKGKPAVPDENAAVRAQLHAANKINLFDRLVTGNHFAHNKFIVFCDRNDKPVSVWTGSTNTTVTGLCTQVNNGLLIKDPSTALAYKNRWDQLHSAGNGYPLSLSVEGSTPAKNSIGTAPITAWNVPCNGFVDLNDAQRYIKAAKQGVLFLMFNPGTGGGVRAESLLQDIQDLGTNGLYIHGVINQAQASGSADDEAKTATVQFTQGNKLLPEAPAEAITPHELTAAGENWFHQAFRFNMVMIHSKVIVIDPFGANPVVMTGSHNMGPKASQFNDDNLAIIENAPGLAAEYAVNILGVYGHYKRLYNAWATAAAAAAPTPKGQKKPPVPVAPKYDGNVDSDEWQTWETTGANLQQLQFMMGLPIAQTSDAAPGTPHAPALAPRKAARKAAPKAAKKVVAKKVAAKRAPRKKAK